MVSILTRSHSINHGRQPTLSRISPDQSYPEPRLINDGIDRLAIFLDLGLHDRVFQDQPETCIDALAIKQSAKSSSSLSSSSRSFSLSISASTSPSSSDPSSLIGARSVKRIVRSISVRVRSTQSDTSPLVLPRRFSYPSVDRTLRRRQRPEGDQLPSLHVVLEQTKSELKLERWNSQKGRKWEAINIKKREEEFKKRLEEKRCEQRLRAVSKALGRLTCMGTGELKEAETTIPS